MDFIRAFGYVQVEGKSQVNIDDLKRQERVIRGFSAENGIILDQIYNEKCCSSNVDNRIALAKMFISLDLNEQDIKTVVIECMERLSSEFALQEIIVHDLREKGYNLLCVRECKELQHEDTGQKLVRDAVSVAAAYHKQMYDLKMRAWREFIQQVERKRVGEEGAARSAHRRKPTAVSPEIAKEIKKLRCKMPGCKQMSCQEIADLLNHMGHSTSNGRPFNSQIIRAVLKRPQRTY